MTHKGDLSLCSCWIVTEGLIGLRNQAIGLARALGISSYTVKDVPKRPWWRLRVVDHGLTPPWPDILISCGRQSVAASVDVRRTSGGKTFTVHVQDPAVDPACFDVVVAPAHDRLQGENVIITQGAVHHVTLDKIKEGAIRFKSDYASLPRPLICVLVGGKNKHQALTPQISRDLSAQLLAAVQNSHGGLAVSFSRRTGAANETVIRQALASVPSQVWDGKTENPYFGLLGLADAIVVTSDSISMLSEACSTGKPVYVYELPQAGGRHQQLLKSFYEMGVARAFEGRIDAAWHYTPLDETRKAADFVRRRYAAKTYLTYNASIMKGQS